ncbi:MAG: hypothetical protein H7842_02440 [Gammaproteobacteria bacterium SHHR-1]
MSFIVMPLAGLKTTTEDEAIAQATAKAKDTKATQVVLEAKVVIQPKLDVDVKPFGVEP